MWAEPPLIMASQLTEPAIKALIEARDFPSLRNVFMDLLPADVAEFLSELPENEQAIVFRMLPQTKATQVLEYMDADAQEAVLKTLGNEDAARVLNDMSPDDRTALLEELPPQAVTQALRLLSPEERKIAQTLLNFP